MIPGAGESLDSVAKLAWMRWWPSPWRITKRGVRVLFRGRLFRRWDEVREVAGRGLAVWSASKHAALSGHHRSLDAACKRERPIAPWLHQRAVKLPHPSSLLVGPVRRSGRTQDRFVPIALVLPQSFRAPMPRCNARLDRHGRTNARASPWRLPVAAP